MNDVVIRVENLGKRYYIGARQERYNTLRDSLVGAFAGPIRRFRNLKSRTQNQEPLWALKDVSLEVKSGEVVGIIGRNGAGKSTLLKILSHITEPTEGCVRLHGRIGSLLEVGTGFHPELTGRENIYLNGAILGMKKVEIERKFDEIVAFSEIEKFLDTPVKRYSSGMYVRLAFAVAAHLEPEILLVDEVLAVGDASFQKKCLGKMGDVAREGRTVLFVSHNLPAVTRLCSRAILLHVGKLVEDNESNTVVSHYMRSDLGTAAIQEWGDQPNAPGDHVVRLRAVRIQDTNGKVAETIDIRKAMAIEMEYLVLKDDVIIRPSFIIRNDEGICAFATTDTDQNWVKRPRVAGRYVSTVIVPGNFLAEGGFSVTTTMAPANGLGDHFVVDGAVSFQVVDTLDGDSARGVFAGPFPGVVRPKLTWTTHLR